MSKTPIPRGKKQVIDTYGNPTGLDGKLSDSWRRANIIALPIPFPAPYNKMRLAWDTEEYVYSIAIHRLAAPDLKQILTEIWNEARKHVKAVDTRPDGEVTTEAYDRMTMDYLRKYGLDLYGGGFNYRKKRGGTSLSTHSWGIAVDLDPARNGMGDTTPAIPLWVVEIFESHGWLAGYRWKGKSIDAMHFQRCVNY